MSRTAFYISGDILQEFIEDYVKEVGLGADSEETIIRVLTNAYAYVVQRCGHFNIETDEVGKSLVFDRARYVRNNAAELFYHNFQHDLMDFAWKLKGESEALDQTTQDDSQETDTEVL